MSRDLTADPDYFPCRDPAITYEQKEARTCKGCSHIGVERAFGSLHQVCKINPARSLEKKCRNYLSTTEAE